MGARIVIADNNTIFRLGIRFFINRRSDMEVVGETGDGKTMVSLVQQLSPDLLIMDINMPDLNDADVAQQITAELSHLKVIAFSEYLNREYVPAIFKAGVSGYLLKSCFYDDLEHAIRTVMENKIYLSVEVTCLLPGGFSKSIRERRYDRF